MSAIASCTLCLVMPCSAAYADWLFPSMRHSRKIERWLSVSVLQNASVSSAVPRVREKLLSLQRKLAKDMSVVMDGRDIGTTILPDADVKIYLTASSLTRAKRRYLELQEKGTVCDLDNIQKDIEERDQRDMNREISPLRQAEDAVLVDSSDLTIEQVVDRILEIFRARTEEGASHES